MYSSEQEELWRLLEEEIDMRAEKLQVGALYDFDLIMRERDFQTRFTAFWKRNRGKRFRFFRPEDIDVAICDDTPPLF